MNRRGFLKRITASAAAVKALAVKRSQVKVEGAEVLPESRYAEAEGEVFLSTSTGPPPMSFTSTGFTSTGYKKA